MINIKDLSSLYSVKELSLDDKDEILNLYKGNLYYFSLLDEMPCENSIIEDLTSFPEGKTKEDKHFIGLYFMNSLMAVIDLVENYPNDKEVYIGLFMMNVMFQNRGIGSSIINELAFALDKQGFKSLKLAYLSNNMIAIAFWTKNGFISDGKVSTYKGKEVIEVERRL